MHRDPTNTARELERGSIKRVCSGCGTMAEGLWPLRWSIVPVTGIRGSAGERAYCERCQAAGKAVRR